MARCYVESRKSAARGTESIAADTMRHLYSRQHLGKAVVVCDTPIPMLSAARKQWLKLARTIQKQRASTLNADKILKYTHVITRMQHMHFSAKSPVDYPEADVYFLHPGQTAIMPIHCWTVYVMSEIDEPAAQAMLRLLPSEALVVAYGHAEVWERIGLQPKRILEQGITQEWQQINDFLRSYDIDITQILRNDIHDMAAMDDALDTLLGISHKFLLVANNFQRALELGRPLRLTREVRERYDSIALLAHRVQALSPGAFTQQFLEVYNEDDTFFLYDRAREAAQRYSKLRSLGLLFPLLPPVGNALRGLGIATYAQPIIGERTRLQFDFHYPYMLQAYKPKLPIALAPKRTG